ncbi:MAG TPA: exo-beta-N-acetylmuramidase NamZ domain-containing protein [Polyangiaceae bacterium]
MPASRRSLRVLRRLGVGCASLLLLASCGASTPQVTPPGAPLTPPAERPEPAPPAAAEAPAIDWAARFSGIDEAAGDAITEGRIPGCVVTIGRHDGVLFERAYGSSAILPEREPMRESTVFDLASLTKPIATATSVMILAERGVISLDAPAATYVPEFGRLGKGSITLRQLLTHTAGLPSETALSTFDHGRAAAMRAIDDLLPRPLGDKFVYSDVGFLVLEEVVRRVAGEDLDTFAQKNVFEPLGMHETMFHLDDALRGRAAPTEQRDGEWIRGDVHDPRAYKLGGVAGHAGLFSTAADLSRYARAMLGEGALDGARILTPRSVEQMFAPHDVPGGIRALGWDVQSGYSQNRGDSLSRRAVGHGGYTGTSLWIDPAKDLFVIVLSNRVHPDGHGAVNALAGRIGSIAGDAVAPERTLRPECAAAAGEVQTGIDVLRDEEFARLRGAHVGLITNVTGRARDGTTTIALLHDAPEVSLVALFAPEHGLGASREGLLADDHDEATGLPVYSLFGGTFRPTPESLAGIDTLVFDVQDVGTRFYTYASTMHRAMQTAAEAGLRFVVLDRPNPIDALRVEGPLLREDAAQRGFVNHFPLPVRHGMTIGELALLIDASEHLGLALDVVPMRGYRRDLTYDRTGLPWMNPSPNLRNVDEELLYPGVGLLEGTNLSVGRGTATPFEVVGAPWIDGATLVAALGHEKTPGVTFTPARFTPDASVFRGEECQGVHLHIVDRAAFEPVRTGLALARALAGLYPEWHVGDVEKLLQEPRLMDALKAGASLDDLMLQADQLLPAWRAKREKYLIYPSIPCVGGDAP